MWSGRLVAPYGATNLPTSSDGSRYTSGAYPSALDNMLSSLAQGSHQAPTPP